MSPNIEVGSRATADIATFASGLRLEDVPPSVVHRAKLILADSIGCMVAGLDGEEVPEVVALAGSIGAGQSTIVGNRPQSIVAAVFVNAYLLSASTAMDSFAPASFHLTPEVVPPTLVLGEARHSPGTDVLASVIVGLEVGVRIAIGSHPATLRERGWHAPGVLGPFAAAAASGHLLGLDPQRMQSAFGLAGSQAAGTYSGWGTPAVKFNQARGALSGIVAALLADQGFPAGKDALTASDGGLYRNYSDGGDPSAAVDGLGSQWALTDISLRRWPGPHNAVAQAVLLFRMEFGFSLADLAELTISVSPERAGRFATFDKPATRFEALNSIPHVAAVALRDGVLTPAQFDAAAYLDPALARFRDQHLKIDVDSSVGDRVLIAAETTTGRRIESESTYKKGEPADPLTENELRTKFEEACGRRLSPDRVAVLWDVTMQLERVADVGTLMAAVPAHSQGQR